MVFTKNATEALNLVAYSWSLANLKTGDEVRRHACSAAVMLSPLAQASRCQA